MDETFFARHEKMVWKVVIDLQRNHTVSLPIYAKPIFVGLDPATGAVAVWFEVNPAPDGDRQSRTFTIAGTGHPVMVDDVHIGSVISGAFVWHVYEQVR